jgi:hypothetical protein
MLLPLRCPQLRLGGSYSPIEHAPTQHGMCYRHPGCIASTACCTPLLAAFLLPNSRLCLDTRRRIKMIAINRLLHIVVGRGCGLKQ